MNSFELFGNTILFDSSNALFFFLRGIELHNLVFPLKKQINFITRSLFRIHFSFKLYFEVAFFKLTRFTLLLHKNCKYFFFFFQQ